MNLRHRLSMIIVACLLIASLLSIVYPTMVVADARSEPVRPSEDVSATPAPQFDRSILYLDPTLEFEAGRTSPAGADCSTPTVFDDHWSEGYRLVCQNNLYVLMVDLTNPAVKVEVAALGSGIATVSGFADANTIAVLNADYQFAPCSGTVCAQGLTIVNGSNPTTYTNISHLCSDARVRREIGLSEDGRVVVDWWFKFVSDSQARAWCGSIPENGGGQERYSYNLVGGGPQFTFDGAFHWDCQYGMDANHNCLSSGNDVGINGEHFGPGTWWNRYQSAIGYTTDGQVLVLAESNNRTHTMQEVHDILYQRLQSYGKTLKNAFKFDGGSKAGFWYYNHTYDSTPGVTVPTVIRIQRTNSTCYSLSTNVNPGGAGNIDVQTASNCAQGKYRPGTNVTIAASPNSGYNFSSWSGDASGSSPSVTVSMNGNKNVTANFTPSQVCYGLNTNVNPSGGGSVNLNPGPNCNGNQYASGTNVQLTAGATSGYSFSSWSGDAAGSSNPLNITMNGNKDVTANFTANPVCYSLSLLINPGSAGSITPNPAPNCGSQYTSGTSVQLTANAGGGYSFSSWSGDASGTGNPTTVVMNGNRNVTANFTANPVCYSLALFVNPGSAGSITPNPAPNCGSQYASGTNVQLTANANSGFAFANWSGDASGTNNPTTVTMNGNRSVTAYFGSACTTITDWKGEYWNNIDLSGSSILCRNDFALDFDWGLGAPDPSISSDNFAARWTRLLDFPAGSYRFHLRHDDGARLFVDGVQRLDVWGTCCVWDIADVTLSSGGHTIRVDMFDSGGAAHVALWWERLDITGWRGEYYNNETLSDHPMIVRDDGANLSFDWQALAPDPVVQPDHFSVRWTRAVSFAPGDYRFDIFHDDGARFYVDGALVFENWCGDCRQTDSVTVTLTASVHDLKLEMREVAGWAGTSLNWSRLTTGSNDDFDSPTQISYLPYVDNLDTSSATSAGDDPWLTTCNRNRGTATVWYRWVPNKGGTIQVNTFGSDYDTLLAVWTGARGGLTNIACNDDASGTLQSLAAATVSAGTPYYIEVAQYGTSLTNLKTRWLSAGASTNGTVAALGGILHLEVVWSQRVYLPMLIRQDSP